MFQNENKSDAEGWRIAEIAWAFLNAVFDHAAPVMAGYGLHQKSLVLLALLDRGDSPQELAHLLRTPPSTLSHLLRELEEKKLIERAIDAHDRRRFRLRRTPAGDEALAAGIAAVNEAVAGRLDGLTGEERGTLERALPLLARLAGL